MRTGEAKRRSPPRAAGGGGQRRLAHDLNNLLAVIAGHLQLLEPHLQDRPELLSSLTVALRACFKGALRVEEVLAAGRGAPPTAELVDGNRVLQAWCEEVAPSLLGPRIRLVQAFAGHLWPCRVARDELAFVLLELALAACERLPKGGTLTVTTRNARLGSPRESLPAGAYAVIGVGATVPNGVDADVGRPVPLALARAFARRWGGHLEATAGGAGEEMRLWLPRAPRTAA